MLETIIAVGQIVILDLVLSGDNAVVIGMAARNLSDENRRRAIVIGGGAAVGLRILFTTLAALLLDIPYLHALGGVLLLWIASSLLRPSHDNDDVTEAGSLGEAIRTIVVADAVMSLDNILAVGGASHGNILLLLFGLGLSIPLLMFGSSLVARLMNRLPLLVYIGVLILIVTAVQMIAEDDLVTRWRQITTAEEIGVIIVVAALIIGLGVLRQRGASEDETSRDQPPLNV
jgi:YjbE family integral membrane protein